MLRPEQITNAKFTPVSTGAYNADEVDAFLSVVGEAYQELAEQNTALIKKISILADKVESYRKDEDAIKSALLDAHRMAEDVSRSANEKATGLVADAESRAKEISEAAEKQALELSNAARAQAGDIVTNAKSAVASIKERAEAEAGQTIARAQDKASSIIGEANRQSETIIGTSKKDYEFYTAELSKVKSELEKFRTMVEMLCNGEITPEEAAPIVSESRAAQPVEAPVQAETPVVETPAEEVPTAPVSEQEDDLDDILSLFDDGNSDFGIAADIDNIEPDVSIPDFAGTADKTPEESPAAEVSEEEIEDYEPVIPEKAEEEPAAAENTQDDFFNDFKVDLDGMDDLNIPGTDSGDAEDDDDISSLFDSLFD
jgi:cell division initiation protein